MAEVLSYTPKPHADALALIRRAAHIINQWAEKYGEHDPQWLPPPGVVNWQEDVSLYIAMHALPDTSAGARGCSALGGRCEWPLTCEQRGSCAYGVQADRRGLWQHIETAPHDREVLFWIRPKTPDETYLDSADKPILTEGEPHSMRCKLKCWGSLWTATHWMEPWEPAAPSSAVPCGVDSPDVAKR